MSRWFPSKGVKPNTSAEKCFVRYRCGLVSKDAYPVKSQRWHHIGDDWDILEWMAAEDERKDQAA